MSFLFGAGDRTRTGTLLPAADFESATSTNFITPAYKEESGYLLLCVAPYYTGNSAPFQGEF